MVVRLSALRTGHLYPQEMLLVIISVKGWVDSRILCQWKIPMAPAGIEPATFRFVARRLNHCATAAPLREVRGSYLGPETDYTLWGSLFCSVSDSNSFYTPNSLCTYTPFHLRTERDKIYEKLYCILNTADIVTSPTKSTSEPFKMHLKIHRLYRYRISVIGFCPEQHESIPQLRVPFMSYFSISLTPYQRSTK